MTRTLLDLKVPYSYKLMDYRREKPTPIPSYVSQETDRKFRQGAATGTTTHLLALLLFYLLYYSSTCITTLLLASLSIRLLYSQSTCFTSTKVLRVARDKPQVFAGRLDRFTRLNSIDVLYQCFTSTKVQILTQKGDRGGSAGRARRKRCGGSAGLEDAVLL